MKYIVTQNQNTAIPSTRIEAMHIEKKGDFYALIANITLSGKGLTQILFGNYDRLEKAQTAMITLIQGISDDKFIFVYVPQR